MIINGREIKFLRTVKATSELSKICPNGDLSRLPELFTGDLSTTLETGATISVPLFIDIGDVIRVDTRTGTYMERA